MTDTSLDQAVVEASDRLALAASTGFACTPVRDLIGADVAVAYAVQQRGLAGRIAAGASIVGRKIGLTSEAVQRQLGVDRPDFGVLLDDMAYRDAAALPLERLLQPRVEAEVAFVLATGLTIGPFDAATVAAAVDYAVAALEIVDSRIEGWDITFADTVADNASAGLFVLGIKHVGLDGFVPREAAMELRLNDEVVSTGSGAASLGDPLAALAWLATTAVEMGAPLRAGDVVLSGALGPVVPVGAGDVVAATISGLGSVRASFVGAAG
ncbi:fumarylacetoacetate hydrolase family protein [Streptomyces sp. SID13031]|uniref:2-keto-4-pentenoate hydratase n=1 Tax=Streptomyces sp. SID13031 TaxID=2706046 RepID=UPI0013CAB038|nr:fumarylacetoacetate hydrolase family protein [Streptomyces sp. SID13031]NEA30525.1 2-keto-4-pentenoate hydratase [Streptomyces sp. SID13031]